MGVPPGGEPSAPAFGTLLRRYRLSAGLSQEALAERANLSVEAISTLERGTRRAPYATTLELLADALKLEARDREALTVAVDRHRARRAAHPRALRPALPVPLTRLVGRDRELRLALSLVTSQPIRLLTITGVGGVGKTRFALELAQRFSREFEDGAVFASLAAIRNPEHIASALAQCLGQEGEGGSTTIDAFCGQVARRRILIVMDNFEQVLAGAPFVVELLRRCSRVVIIATSREPLRVAGEHELVLQALDLAAAVELLTDRAREVQPEIDPGAHRNLFTAICGQLEGLPLAIELAAARLRHYPASALLEQLSSRLDTLIFGSRDAPPRQRTMRDAIEWSYRLLNDAERATFQMISLFVGGGTLEALGSLSNTGGLPDIGMEQLVTSLADKHLIAIRTSKAGQIRFDMLETIREYALEQLMASGRFESCRRRFAEYYAEFAARAAPHLRDADAAPWFDSIAHEYENLREALRWAVKSDRTLGMQLALDIRLYWSRKGYFREAREWLQALVDPIDQTLAALDPMMRWQVLNLFALSHFWVGDNERARRLMADVVALARNLEDPKLIARSLNNLGNALMRTGEAERARLVQEESLEIKQRCDDEWSIATTLSNLGLALRVCRKLGLALERHHEALGLFRSSGDQWGVLASLNDIADVHRDLQDYFAAARFYNSSLDANVDAFRPLAADSFEGLAAVAAARCQFRRTAVLGGASDTIHREAGRSISPPDRPPFEAACEAARAALGPETFDEAWSEGASLPLPEAIEIARTIANDLTASPALS